MIQHRAVVIPAGLAVGQQVPAAVGADMAERDGLESLARIGHGAEPLLNKSANGLQTGRGLAWRDLKFAVELQRVAGRSAEI
jgi:hypothetical protein